MKLRVWWIPQVPGQCFYVPVQSVEQAKFTLRLLADYDTFQFENNIKPDYCNAGGLEEWGDDQSGKESDHDQSGKESDWCEWESAYGENINEVMEEGLI